MPRQPTKRPRRILRPRQVAELFAVSDITVNKWADDGLIPSFRTPGGQRRYYADEIEDFIERSKREAAS